MTDATPPAAPAPSVAPPPPRRHRRWWTLVVVLTSIVAIVGVGGIFYRLPYVIISPGSATPVQHVLEIHGAATHAHKGSVLFLTVSESLQRPNVYRFIQASLDPDDAVVSEHDILEGQTRAQDHRLNVQLMDLSQGTATQVALEKLGYSVPPTGAIVAAIVRGSPADGALRQGDAVTALDGQPVRTADDLGRLVRAHPPATQVQLRVDRGAKTVTVPITTAATKSGPTKGQAMLGVQATTRVKLPVDVKIDPGQVSGPSAGLAFTLTILDELTPGDLTAGHKVAVTGEIEPDGSVGEIGGVEQKAVTARRAGASLMIVPAPEAKAARAHAGKLRVVGVKTLDDALRALRSIGGAPLPRPRAAA